MARRRRRPARAKPEEREIFKRKCPHCLKASTFRARPERAGGQLTIWTVACTSCGVVVGVVPQLARYPQRKEVESIVRGLVRTHVNKAVKAIRKSVRRRR
jgi:endogenous inhibitor of DNA gyrase (YacG/DUF329 family)